MRNRKTLLLLFFLTMTTSILTSRLTELTPKPLAKAATLEPSTLSTITIEADGDINPATAPIQKDGNVYTIKNNLTNHAIKIECNNTTLDGANYILTGRGWASPFPDTAVSINASNVTVKNVDIQNYHTGIYMVQSPNCSILSNKIQCLCGIANGAGCINNQYVGNNITGVDKNYGVGLQCWGYNILISKNNIANSTQLADLSAVYDSRVEGNYWSDYEGEDLNGDSIGDSPCIIDEKNQDPYPLMVPFGSDSSVVLPTPTPEPQSGFFPTVLTVCVISLSVICVISLVYLKKRHGAEVK